MRLDQIQRIDIYGLLKQIRIEIGLFSPFLLFFYFLQTAFCCHFLRESDGSLDVFSFFNSFSYFFCFSATFLFYSAFYRYCTFFPFLRETIYGFIFCFFFATFESDYFCQFFFLLFFSVFFPFLRDRNFFAPGIRLFFCFFLLLFKWYFFPFRDRIFFPGESDSFCFVIFRFFLFIKRTKKMFLIF